ncbi:cation:proton antiporter [Nocardioides coralli]|uniref:cation:proton antiporter domain-containing protein n=1 Tax=Nocardioides coralli TaxID=2872154 RepID=UPI001CA3FFB3|nr:cation:proton antiporter [Nocardioides coralli]QZY30464.1 cation:proton antiporter [Nocardioides coralli]
MEGHDLHQTIALVFIDIALIVVVARLLGLVMRRIRQPVVIAEILAGLALGPSLLGLLPGDLTETLFPSDVRPYLAVIAALGLTIYMFVVGLELDLGLIRGKGATAGTISVVSVTLPFLLGSGLAVWLHSRHGTVEGEEVSLLPFVLFIGAAMSVTAFPVLARILSERGLNRTSLGAITLACAAVDDVLAWIMLAAVLAVVQSSGGIDLLLMVSESVAFVAVMFWFVKPRLRLLVARRERAERLTPDIFAVVLVGVLVSSVITDKIGIHAIFGAFLFGAIMPRQGAEKLSSEILERVEQMTVLLLLPVFFVVTGLRVDVTDLGREGLLEFVAVLTVACVGKFAGAAAAARFMGVRPRRAASIGVLMNTRGLTELVVLNIGLSVGILDEELFTVMVLMAIVTTIITEPLMRLIYPDHEVARDVVEAERAALGLSAEHRVLVLPEPATAESLVDCGVGLLGRREDAELLVTRIERRDASSLEVGSGLISDFAAVASALEGLEVLAGRARAAGAVVHVTSRLSDDPGSEAAVHAEATGAEVVLVAAGSDLADAVAGDRDRVVVELVPFPGGSPVEVDGVRRVAVWPGVTTDGVAAVEQAIRLAERLGAELLLVTEGQRRAERRAGMLERRLTGTGVAAARTDSLVPDPTTVLVTGRADAVVTPDGGAGVLVVRGRGDDDERLERMLARRTPEAVG